MEDDMSDDYLVLDSGADRSLLKDIGFINNVRPTQLVILQACGDNHHPNGEGDMTIVTDAGDFIMERAIYDQAATDNLLSIASLANQGCTVVLRRQDPYIIFPSGHRVNLYYNGKEFRMRAQSAASRRKIRLSALPAIRKARITNTEAERQRQITELHRQMAHRAFSSIKKDKAKGKFQHIILPKTLPSCLACELIRQSRKRRTRSQNHIATLHAKLHVDVKGPMHTRTGRRMFILTFTDEASRLSWHRFLESDERGINGTDAVRLIDDIEEWVRNKKKRHPNINTSKLRFVHSDGAAYFIQGQFAETLADRGVTLTNSDPYTPHQNGMAERVWRTLTEKAEIIMMDLGLSDAWACHVLRYVANQNNLVRHTATNQVPYEMFSPASMESELFEFFEMVSTKQPPNKENTSKMQRKSLEDNTIIGRYLYFDTLRDQHHILLQDPDGVIRPTSRVRKYPKGMIFRLRSPKEIVVENQHKSEAGQRTNYFQQVLTTDEQLKTYKVRASKSQETNTLQILTGKDPEQQQLRESIAADLMATAHLPYGTLPYSPFYSEDKPVSDEEIQRLRSAHVDIIHQDYINGLHRINRATRYREALKDELDKLKKYGVFGKPVKRKQHMHLVHLGGTAICKASGKRKVRIHVQGHRQSPDTYSETWAPTSRYNSVRMQLAKATRAGRQVRILDIESAYLTAELEDEIYVHPHKGILEVNRNDIPPGEDPNDYVFPLLKPLYGLKQGGAAFHKTCTDIFDKFGGMTGFVKEQGTWTCRKDTRTFTMTTVVDDWVIDGDKSLVDEFIKFASRKFKISEQQIEIGQEFQLLGLELKYFRAHNKLNLSIKARRIGKRIVDAFDDQHISKANPNPVTAHHYKMAEPSAITSLLNASEVTKYQRAVGGLIFIATTCRPDLSFATSILSTMMSSPNTTAMKALFFTLRYLNTSLNEHQGKWSQHDLIYRQVTRATKPNFCDKQEINLVAYVDSDHRSPRSTGGYAFIWDGNLIDWESKRQPTTALSSTEAEWLALASCMKNVIYMRDLFAHFGFNMANPIEVAEDNAGVVRWSQELYKGVFKKRMHIDKHTYYINDIVRKRYAKVRPVSTTNNLADIFTKGLSYKLHTSIMKKLLNYGSSTETPISDPIEKMMSTS